MAKQKEQDAVEEITFDYTIAEKRHPRLFNSLVNHISEIDLTNSDSAKIDGEYFLVETRATAAA